MVNKLKPCPFCGSPAEVEADESIATVQCRNMRGCWAGVTALADPEGNLGRATREKPIQTAIRRWNRRTVDTPQK